MPVRYEEFEYGEKRLMKVKEVEGLEGSRYDLFFIKMTHDRRNKDHSDEGAVHSYEFPC